MTENTAAKIPWLSIRRCTSQKDKICLSYDTNNVVIIQGKHGMQVPSFGGNNC